MIVAALAVAGVLLLLAPLIYRANRLRLLLVLVIPYVAACIFVLADVSGSHPILAGGISVLLGSIPVALLVIATVDMRLGLFATDTLWIIPMAIFPLLALAPATLLIYLFHVSGA